MEGTFHGNDLVPLSSHLLLGKFTREFQRPFIRLGSAVAKEDLVGKGVPAEKRSQLDLGLDIVEV